RLLDEGAEDGVRGDLPRRAPAHELLDEPTVVVSMDVGQEHVQHIRRRDPDLVEVGERFRGRIDEDALAVDPDDEARKVATRVEAVAGCEGWDPDTRQVARALYGHAEASRDARGLAGPAAAASPPGVSSRPTGRPAGRCERRTRARRAPLAPPPTATG